MQIVKIYIGYDENEIVAFHTLSHSIIKNSSLPVSITPICLSHLTNIYTREISPLQSTQFSFSRFLTPLLSSYNGFSIFMDCDMLFLGDIATLWEQRNDKYAIQVVKHNHSPKEKTKFLGNTQSKYEKKNWSSMMIFNNSKCKVLSQEYVNQASGLELHQFKWLEDEKLIGNLDIKYNYLVGENQNIPDIQNIHYTNGGPYFEEYKNCEYSKEWKEYLKSMLYAKDESAFLQKAIKDIE